MLWEAGLTKLIKFGGRQFNKVKGLAVLVMYDLSVSQESGRISPLPSESSLALCFLSSPPAQQGLIHENEELF